MDNLYTLNNPYMANEIPDVIVSDRLRQLKDYYSCESSRQLFDAFVAGQYGQYSRTQLIIHLDNLSTTYPEVDILSLIKLIIYQDNPLKKTVQRRKDFCPA